MSAVRRPRRGAPRRRSVVAHRLGEGTCKLRTSAARPACRSSARRSAPTSSARSAQPRRRGAGLAPPGPAATPTRELDDAVDVVARGLLAVGLEPGDRVGIWSPNYAEWVLVQYATAKVGVILVNINPAYRTHELEYALRPVGLPVLVAGAVVQDVGLRGDGRRGRAPSCPTLEQVDLPRSPRVGRPAGERRRAASPPTGCASAAGTLAVRRPDQHPVHERHDRVPEGRHAHRTTTSSTTATSSGERCGYTDGRPGVHPGALLPLLRHGARQPRVHHPRRRAS